MARPRKADARDTRRVILDAALDLFAVHSYSGTSMRMVARAVGVRESALYHHFPSKESILEALMAELGPGKAVLRIDPDVVEQVGAQAFFRNLSQMLWTTWSTPTEIKFARVLIGEGARQALPEHLHPRTVLAGIRKMLTALIAELMERKLLRTADPSAVTLQFMGPLMFMRMQYFVMWPHPPAARVVRKELDAVAELFWCSVEPSKKPKK